MTPAGTAMIATSATTPEPFSARSRNRLLPSQIAIATPTMMHKAYM